MSKHALGAAHRNSASMRAEDLLNGLRFGIVAKLSAGAVCVDVLETSGLMRVSFRANFIAILAPLPSGCGAVML